MQVTFSSSLILVVVTTAAAAANIVNYFVYQPTIFLVFLINDMEKLRQKVG